MKKSELIDEIANRSGETKACVSKVLDLFMDTTTNVLAGGGKLALPGFITFETTTRAARTGRNPQTGATIHIPAAVVPRIKAGKNLKDAVSGA